MTLAPAPASALPPALPSAATRVPTTAPPPVDDDRPTGSGGRAVGRGLTGWMEEHLGRAGLPIAMLAGGALGATVGTLTLGPIGGVVGGVAAAFFGGVFYMAG